MAEGRETDAVAERPVELAYRPTVGDLASALRARARSTGAGRFQRRALVWMVAVTTVGALLSAAGSGRHDTPWQLYAGVVVFAAFMTAGGGGGGGRGLAWVGFVAALDGQGL
ncbi:hypothetical protein [Streptomyces sp. WAC00263]|uniref:hypothetical protein n=1 Tax=Streptomyces sp. WAC00263 TaxID=1917422 RepID=UPI0015EEEBE7|nr:hypothetical protein [Streptomyces sp. WAC00263]KAF5993660.1 hypothetical protein BOG92_019340 [Streptomyces sp. WAC00263]